MMKTKLNPMMTAVAVLMALIFSASGKDGLPVGNWTVGFANGVVETCEIAGDGKVKVRETGRQAAGVATVKGEVVEILYEDDRLERWSLREGEMAVEHWHTASDAGNPKRWPMMGIAEKNEAAALEVHEWGTFTVLQGSDGQVIPWYQAPNKLVDLPSFVQQARMGFGKSGTIRGYAGALDTVRMETPVLYFYPEEEMDITVAAAFPDGRITEVFPPLAGGGFGGGGQSIWRGTLLPPDSPELSKVPAAEGAKGRHYAAARAVPEAWLFRNKPMPKLAATAEKTPLARAVNGHWAPQGFPKVKKVDPIDHFIFYRGAGRLQTFEISARQLASEGTFELTNRGNAVVPKLFALCVEDGKSSWVAFENLKKLGWDKEAKQYLNRELITFPEAVEAAEDVAVQLRAEMVAALVAEGLTEAEAKAMVATWDDLWFTEPGTRVLAVLPKSFADKMVPLQIAPRPKKIERVFVARLELITREDEAVLTELLNTGDAKFEELGNDAKRLRSLELGRYAAGGMERARTLVSRKMQQRFYKLEQEAARQQKLQAAAAAAAAE